MLLYHLLVLVFPRYWILGWGQWLVSWSIQPAASSLRIPVSHFLLSLAPLPRNRTAGWVRKTRRDCGWGWLPMVGVRLVRQVWPSILDRRPPWWSSVVVFTCIEERSDTLKPVVSKLLFLAILQRWNTSRALSLKWVESMYIAVLIKVCMYRVV